MNDEEYGKKRPLFEEQDCMTGEEAFMTMYALRGEDYPDDMKQEFITLYDRWVARLLTIAAGCLQPAAV